MGVRKAQESGGGGQHGRAEDAGGEEYAAGSPQLDAAHRQWETAEGLQRFPHRLAPHLQQEDVAHPESNAAQRGPKLGKIRIMRMTA